MKKKYLKALVELKITLDRGNAWIYWLRNLIIVVAGLKYTFELDILTTALTGLFVISVIYCLGILDIRYMKFFQLEQKLITSKYNPHLNKVGKTFK